MARVKSNYSNDDKTSPPFKKGRFQDVVQPRRSQHTKVSYASNKAVTDALAIDLVQVLADAGICLKNVHTLAKGLTRLGWIKATKPKG